MVVSFHGDPNMDWNYKTEPEPVACQGFPEKRCTWPRGKVLGGCSVINGMMYTRGTPRDYDNWEAAGNPGWGYKDVLPVFKRFEDNKDIGTFVEAAYHGRGGPLTTSRFNDQPEMAYDILRAAREAGYKVTNDLNGRDFSGFTIAQANTRNGVRLSSARAYLRPNRNNPNLHVMLNSTATRILVKQTGNQKVVQGVEFLYKGRPHTVKVRKEVVLAAGAINSPQILLLSGIGPKDELDKVGIKQVHDLPGVGKNLRNHVAFYMTFDLKKLKDYSDLDWANALDYILNKRGPMSSTGMSQVTARINSPLAEPSGKDPDLQMFFAGFLAQCASSGEVRAAADPENPDAPKTLTVSPVTLHPKSQGYIGLRSKDPLQPPVMVANYLTAPEDAAVLVEGVRIIQKLANTTVLRQKYGIHLQREEYGDCAKRYGYDTDNFWHCAVRYYTGPENHQACSCKMGPSSDPMAVVDNKLALHGIDGIRIMDASAMPALVSGNTHATIVMMAERGVDFIKEKWGPASTIGNRGGYPATSVVKGGQTSLKPPSFTTRKPYGYGPSHQDYPPRPSWQHNRPISQYYPNSGQYNYAEPHNHFEEFRHEYHKDLDAAYDIPY
ncbi:unnamed protein product [Callosobruchus maculatus]|uniref:Glucose-methanol-choline oxidoreductase N-terminal domain-containing protein n=1 Tax=Callosobruchus maculatus TaxID=64391 RepID=A0A653CXU2_CALMS|nr:unnamed protein product [Callosobruchus maculatus]